MHLVVQERRKTPLGGDSIISCNSITASEVNICPLRVCRIDDEVGRFVDFDVC